MTNVASIWLPAYVAIGSNLDDPTSQVRAAFDALAGLPETRVELRSSLYRSAPLGPPEQPDFVNAVVGLLTRLSPNSLLQELLRLEVAAGRIRGENRWGPRVLDLDLLAMADEFVDTPALTLPHPGIAERNFVLLPFAEIAAEYRIPGLGRVASVACNAREPRIERID